MFVVAAPLLAGPFTIYNLGNLGGTVISGAGLNNSGEAVGYAYPPSSVIYSGFLASAGSIAALPAFYTGDNYAEAINDNGEIVGRGGGGEDAYTYSNGVYTDLGAMLGGRSAAFGVNNAGQVVGYSDPNSDFQNQAFLYSAGVFTNLGVLPGGSVSSAYSINDSGQIVGYSSTATSEANAF